MIELNVPGIRDIYCVRAVVDAFFFGAQRLINASVHAKALEEMTGGGSPHGAGRL